MFVIESMLGRSWVSLACCAAEYHPMPIICASHKSERLVARSATNSLFRFVAGIIENSIAAVMRLLGGQNLDWIR